MVDYTRWSKLDFEDQVEAPEDETLNLRIEWHGKMTMADHQFYNAESTGLRADYEKAIARCLSDMITNQGDV